MREQKKPPKVRFDSASGRRPRNDYFNIGVLHIEGEAHNVFVVVPPSIGASVKRMASFVRSSSNRGVFKTPALAAVRIQIERQPSLDGFPQEASI